MSNPFDQFDVVESSAVQNSNSQANPFDQFDQSARDPEEVNNQINASMADRHAAKERNFFNNAARGAGERGVSLAGNLIDAEAAQQEQMAYGPVIPGSMGMPNLRQHIPLEQRQQERIEVNNTANKLRNTDLGYDETRNTLDGAKAKFSKGDYLGAASELFAAGNETLLTSAPDMLGAALPPVTLQYVQARSGEIANENARNQGKQLADADDIARAAPFAIASTALERILPARLLRGSGEITEEVAKEISDQAIKHVLKRAASEGGQSAAIEGGTEFIQEGVIEYIGQRYGTDAAMDVKEALAHGVEAAILGSVGGGTVGSGKGAYSGANDVRQAASFDNTGGSAESAELESGVVAEAESKASEVPGETVDGESLSTHRFDQTVGGTKADSLLNDRTIAQGDEVVWASSEGDQPVMFIAETEGIDGRPFAHISVDGVDSYVPIEQIVKRSEVGKSPDNIESDIKTGNPDIDAELTALMAEFDQVENALKLRQAAIIDDKPVEQAPEQAAPEPAQAPEADDRTIEFVPPNVAGQSGLRLAPLDSNYEGGIDFQAEANTAQRDQLASGIQREIDRYIDEKVDSYLPEGAKDRRLMRDRFRIDLDLMAKELVKGGEVGYIYDEHGRINGRTGSLNPEWFKSMDNLVTTDEAKKAVKKALAGEKLGTRQAAVIEIMLDEISLRKREGSATDVLARWEARKNALISNDPQIIAAKLEREQDHLPEVSPVEALLSEIINDAIASGVNSHAALQALHKYSGRAQGDTQKLIAMMSGWARANSNGKNQTDTGAELQARSGNAERRALTESAAGKNGSQSADFEIDQARASEQELEALFGSEATVNPFDQFDKEGEIAVDIDAVANEAATSPANNLPEPSEAQKEAGNYRKAHLRIQGIDIAIENPRGSIRSGIDPGGNKWEVSMKSHYGYIKKSKGADGDHVDVFVGPNPESERVFVVDQVNTDGSFDEHKVLMGFDSKLKARSGYKANYTNGWKVGPITSMSVDEFKTWIKEGDTTKPLRQDHFQGETKSADIKPDVNDSHTVDHKARELPSILTDSRSQSLKKMAAEKGMKKSSPGYADAMAKLVEEYENEVDRAQASLSFEQFNDLNLDTPENLNRQAHRALRKEFGVTDDLAVNESSGLYSADDRNKAQLRIKQPGLGDDSDPQWDLFAPRNLPSDTSRQQSADNFHVRYEQVATSTFPIGISRVSSPEDAAHVFAPLRKHAQESFLVLVTDDAGKILNLIRHTKGAKDASSVYPAEVIGAIASTPGASKVWFGHNHPSGKLDPSGADHRITERLIDVMDGMDLEYQGHVIVGEGRNAAYFRDNELSVETINITAAPRGNKVSVTERVIKKRVRSGIKIDSPASALKLVRHVEADSALVLLDTQLEFVGSIAMSPQEMATLRESGRVTRILSALGSTNAAAVIIKTEDHESAKNVARFVNRIGDIRMLDWFSPLENGGYRSDAEHAGLVIGSEGAFFSLASSSDSAAAPGNDNLSSGQDGLRAPISEVEADAVIARIISGIGRAGRGSGNSLQGLDELRGIRSVANFTEFPLAVQKHAKDQGHSGKGVEGVFHDGSIYINREALSTPADVERVVFHELYGHYGLRKLFDTTTRQAMGSLYLAIGGTKGLEQIAAKHGIDLRHYARGYMGEVKQGRMDADTMRSIMMEELLAHIAQDNKPNVKRRFKELLGQLRAWLRERGFMRTANASDSELFYLLRQARDAVQTGAGKVADGTLLAVAQPMFSLTKDLPGPTRRIIANDPVLAAWTVLSLDDSAFQLPISQKQSLEEIFAELEPDIKIRRAPEFDIDGAKVWAINPDKNTLALVFEKGKTVWIDVADYSPGEGGRRIYNTVANYAYNTTKTFVGDPAGLSDKAMARRLENMISSALKFGTTRHLWPHERQERGGAGVKSIKWKDGDDAHNLKEMISASYEATLNQFPEIRDLRYNSRTDEIEGVKDGKVYSRTDLKEIASRKRASSSSGGQPVTAGSQTLERAILTHTILRGTRQEQFNILAALGDQRSQRFSGSLYSLKRPDSDPEPRPSAGVSVSGTGKKFASPDESLEADRFAKATDTVLRVWADKMRPLLNTQREIEKVSGKISEDVDAYRAEELFHGKTENDLRKMEERYIEPLTKKMAEFNIERDELDMYLWAAHASERNKQVAKINPKMPDGGSGMTSAQALEVLKKAKGEGKLKHLAELSQYVYGMLKQRREIMKGSLQEDGLIDAWDETYKYYVPLKGRAADESGGKFPRVGKGFDIRGKESLRALGRRTKPESPVLHAIRDTTESIIRYRKNEVGNTFLALVETYPNPDFWNVYTSDSPELQPRLKTVGGKEVVGEGAVIDKNKYFITKKNGKEYFIDLKDEKLLRAMKNMGPEPMNMVMRFMGMTSRFLSSMNTTYNPEFTITNFARDIQTAVINMLAEQDLHDGKAKGKKIATSMVKGVPFAIKAIHASLRNKTLGGKYAEWQKSFDDFRNDGAKTGWFDMKDIDGQAKELENLINMRKSNAKGVALRSKKAIGDFVENVNGAIENGIRLSAYKSAVDAGISRKQAASLAKNLTVNFNRKGEIGQAMNSLYMFFNASVQGTAAFARAIGTLKLNEDGSRSLNLAQKMGIGITMSAFALALLNREMAGEDDDEKNWYDKVPDYVKERNIVIMKSIVGGEPGEYWTIPLPYGYNIFNVIGGSAEAAIAGSKGVGEAGADIVRAFFGSFSPIGIAESSSVSGAVARTLAPTIAKPIVDIAANENFFGGPVYRENFQFGTPKPESQLSMRSTNVAWKWLAEFMNDATGGSQFRSGAVDVSPDKLGYVFDYMVGSSGAFYSKLVHMGIKTAQDREIEGREIPFLRKVSGKVMRYEDQSKFYERKDEIDQSEKEWKSLRGAERISFYKEHGAVIKMKSALERTEKQLKKLRKQRDDIEENEELSEKTKDARLELVEKQMKMHIDRFNKQWPDQ